MEACLSCLAKRCGSGVGIGSLVAKTEDGVLSDPNLSVACHSSRIAEEQESTGDEGRIEDVHACAAEDFLSENHAESNGDGEHPKRTSNGHNHGNDDAGYKEAFLDFLVLPLCNRELDAEADNVADNNLRQNGQEAVPEHAPERRIGQVTCGESVLVTHVIHTEEQSRHQGNHHETHDALAVDSIVDIHATYAAGCVRNESKRLETVHQRAESVELATFLNVGMYVIE